MYMHKVSPSMRQSKGRKERQVEWGGQPQAGTDVVLHAVIAGSPELHVQIGPSRLLWELFAKERKIVC